MRRRKEKIIYLNSYNTFDYHFSLQNTSQTLLIMRYDKSNTTPEFDNHVTNLILEQILHTTARYIFSWTLISSDGLYTISNTIYHIS